MPTSTHHLAADSGTAVGFGLALRVSADVLDGAFSVHEGVLEPGQTVPPHVHETADQLLYVVDGSVLVTVGDERIEAGQGDFVHKPRGVSHTFTNATELPARVLELTVSDQFERFTEAATALDDPAQLPALQARYGMTFGADPLLTRR